MSTGEKVALGLLGFFFLSIMAGVVLGPFFGFNQLPKDGDE